MTGSGHSPSGGRRLVSLAAGLALVASIVAIAPASVGAAVAHHVQFFVAPPSNVAVGDKFPVSVGVYDATSTLITGTSFDMSLTWTGTTLAPLTCDGTGTGPISTSLVTGLATFTLCHFDTPGMYQITAWASGVTIPATSGVINVAAGTGNKLVFIQQPGGAAVGAPFSPQPIVEVQDAYGSPVFSLDGATIQLSKISGPGDLSCLPGSGITVIINNARASWTGCTMNAAGTYTLGATTGLSGGPTPATSSSFVIGSGTAAALVFRQSPASGPGPALSPNPIVQVVDSLGRDVAGLYEVQLTLQTISGFGSLTCDATDNKMWTGALTGRAVFTGCRVVGAGQFLLRASSLGSGLVVGISDVFTVGASNTQVVFTTQPLGANLGGTTPTGVAGTPWTIQPVVALQDLTGQTFISDFTSRVTLTIAPGTPTSGGPGVLTCTGGNTVQVTRGVATFAGCSINTAGTAYQLRATVSNSSTVPNGTFRDSLAFNISAVSQIAFTTQPLGATIGTIPNGSAGAPFSTQPVVTVRNTAGQQITMDFSTRITLSIAPGSPLTGGPGVLSCTGGNTVTVSAGVATFTGCSINVTGTSYRLRATVTSSTTVPVGSFTDSLPFNLTLAAAQISLTTYPSVVTWGDPFTATIQFTGGGNHTFTLQRLAATDNGVWQTIPASSSTFTTDSSGRAVIQYTPRFNGDYRVSFAGDSTLGAGTSNTRTVNVRNLVLLRPAWSGTKTVNTGFTETYQATVRPVPSGGLPGGVARVEFQFWRLTGGTWVKVKSTVVGLNSSGVGTLRYTWNSPGQWYIRAKTLPNIYNFVGTSPLQRINVQ